MFFRHAQLDLCSYCERARREISGDSVSDDPIDECNAIVKKKKGQVNGIGCLDAGKSLEHVTVYTTIRSHLSQRSTLGSSATEIGPLSRTVLDIHVLIQPVLCSVFFSLQRGTVKNVKLAMIVHFTLLTMVLLLDLCR